MKFWWTKKTCSGPVEGCGGTHECRKQCRALSEVEPGHCVCVKRHHACGAIRQRLLDLGIIPSATVNVVNRAPLGGAIQLRIGESNLVLSLAEAAQIEVEI